MYGPVHIERHWLCLGACVRLCADRRNDIEMHKCVPFRARIIWMLATSCFDFLLFVDVSLCVIAQFAWCFSVDWPI